MTYREGRFWQPDVTVATIVERDGRFLMVEELVRGQLVLNQPAGHLEPNECIHAAAVRETLEETGWTVELSDFLGAFQWETPAHQSDHDDPSLRKHYLRLAFVGTALSHDPDRPLDTGIQRALWMTRQEIEAAAAHARLRSPLVLHVLQRYWDGLMYPKSIVERIHSEPAT